MDSYLCKRNHIIKYISNNIMFIDIMFFFFFFFFNKKKKIRKKN